MYTIGAIKNADLAKEIYPGWECWFYVGSSCPAEIVEELDQRDNTKVILMDTAGDWTGMFWRFSPASDSSVDVMVSRDTDSRLNFREKHAVDEWLNSDRDFHIMRDHPYHRTEILGGMWGCRNHILKEMDEWTSAYTKGNFWQVDQNFLTNAVYPLVKSNSFVHDEFFEKKPFPTERDDRRFVGQAFKADDTELETSHGDAV